MTQNIVAPEAMAIVVPEAMAGERLDKVLAQLGHPLSRTMIQRLIGCGAVFRHRKDGSELQPVISAREKSQGGERFELHIPPAVPMEIEAEELDLPVLYEDGDLLVVNKPAGMSSHPGMGANGHRGTLVNALLHHCGDTLSGIGGVKRPGIVHRLDKGTSGLLVVAKNDPTHVHLSEQFKARSTSRLYLAIVKGRPHPLQGTIDAPIDRHPKVRQRMAVRPGRGRRAITHYQVVEPLLSFSLISCRLKTGRTHQIRVHMAHKNYPLLGDPLYSRSVTPSPEWPEAARQLISHFDRQALHAKMLGFTHPSSGKPLQFEVEPPEDFQQLLETLRQLHVNQ